MCVRTFSYISQIPLLLLSSDCCPFMSRKLWCPNLLPDLHTNLFAFGSLPPHPVVLGGPLVGSAESTLAESHSFWMLSLPPLWSLVLLTTHRLCCWLWLLYVYMCVCVAVSCCPSQSMLRLSMYLCAIVCVCVCLLALSVMFARLLHSVWFRSESLLSPVWELHWLLPLFVCLCYAPL